MASLLRELLRGEQSYVVDFRANKKFSIEFRDGRPLIFLVCLNHAAWISRADRPRRHIFSYDTSCADHATVANLNAHMNDSSGGDPGVLADYDRF
jgi:hypothetical protein